MINTHNLIKGALARLKCLAKTELTPAIEAGLKQAADAAAKQIAADAQAELDAAAPKAPAAKAAPPGAK